MNITDYILIALIAIAVFFAVRKILKGKGSCSCSCADCAGCKSCCHNK